MRELLSHFCLLGTPLRWERYGEGHINRTYLVVTDRKRYILQRLSRAAFADIPGLMENVAAVTAYLAAQNKDPRACLHLVPTHEGGTWHRDAEGEYWRVYDFIEDSLCLQKPETPEDFYQSAVAFGGFQRQLRDFPARTLHETIPNFHNTPERYRKFHAALAADPLNRASAVHPEIDFYLAREEDGAQLQRLRDEGALPLRVTHNDTKLNNVMLDAHTRQALCVIDLDTVMPGLAAYDFGDSIRFGASTGAEDETDLEKIHLDLSLYEIFSRGFVRSCGEMEEAELMSLPLGARLMTLECGLRFLTDYLDGDRYFAVARPEHNRDRARTQRKLVEEMERNWEAMNKIIRRISLD
ncbi:MAG: aminoglycoside phosphotransferase family protein [Oscillospiraceae bacterium]|nr:aminoglycoside phosphotransferase family protein [Oscillospiraceae bacterium]